MDLRDHEIRCWHDYAAIGGEDVCVPFMVSSRGYGLVWDNPSKTTVDSGLQSTEHMVVGGGRSRFVLRDRGRHERRDLRGLPSADRRDAHAAEGGLRIHPEQGHLSHAGTDSGCGEEVSREEAAAGCDGRGLPQHDQAGRTGSRPEALAGSGGDESRTACHGCEDAVERVAALFAGHPVLRHAAEAKDGSSTRPTERRIRDGLKETIGPNLDTTNPEAAKWWWEKIRDRYVKPYGFDYLWLDETEPDIDPAKDMFSIGSGIRFYNVYPLFHTASVYEGFRRDFGDSRRVMILARAAYLGAQRNGTVFWSSDIVSTWDMLKRSIPAGLNFTATGLPYWDTDIAGFFSPPIPADYHAAAQAADRRIGRARERLANYEDYPELFVRWFEWGAFQPVMRAHGETDSQRSLVVRQAGGADSGEVSASCATSFCRTPTRWHIAAIRPALLICGRCSWISRKIRRSRIFRTNTCIGPAFLVAPVTEQGATHRTVYLPAGCDWYNYWTNERLHGGQTITADAPIDTLPLFVRAGTIVPLGSTVQSAQQPQTIASVRVYPGADGRLHAVFRTTGTPTRTRRAAAHSQS